MTSRLIFSTIVLTEYNTIGKRSPSPSFVAKQRLSFYTKKLVTVSTTNIFFEPDPLDTEPISKKHLAETMHRRYVQKRPPTSDMY